MRANPGSSTASSSTSGSPDSRLENAAIATREVSPCVTLLCTRRRQAHGKPERPEPLQPARHISGRSLTQIADCRQRTNLSPLSFAIVTESQWVGLIAVGVGLGFVVSYIVLRWRHRMLRQRGVATMGRVLSSTRESHEGGRGWVSAVEFVDATGATRQFEARGRFEGDVGVTYDPKMPTRARVTTRSSYPQPGGLGLALAYAGLSVFVLVVVALLVAGALLVTGLWEISDDALHGTRS